MEELQQVIEGCARNERASQEKLYKEYYVPLFCLCRRYFQNDHEAIESVNDGMMKVYSKIGSYRADRGRFFNWVYTIVRNTALDKLRAGVFLPTLPDAYGADETIAETATAHNPLLALEKKDLYILLDQLSPATRVVCNLYYIEGYTIREITERLGLTPGTIKWHLSESRRRLKAVVERHFNK